MTLLNVSKANNETLTTIAFIEKTLADLELLLLCYRGLADTLSYQAAAGIVEALKEEFQYLSQSDLSSYAQRVNRHAKALSQAISEWLLERD